MTVYVSVLCLLLYFTFSSILLHRKQYSKTVFAASLIILALLSAFRSYNVGTDTSRYAQYFQWMKAGSYYCPMEFGYCSLTNYIAHTSLTFQVVLIIEAVILYSSLYFFVKEFVKYEYWSLSVLLFYIFQSFFVSMNTSRQYFALGFVLFAILLWRRCKFFPAFVVFLVAVSIHYAAIICLIFVFFEKKKNKYTNIIFLGAYLLSICVRFLGVDKLLTFFLNLIPKYSHYIGSNQFLVSDSLISILPQILIPNILFISIILYSNKEKVHDDLSDKNACDEGVLSWCALSYVCLLNMFAGSMALSRFSDYFVIPFICFLLSFLNNYFSKKKFEAFSLLIILILVYTLLMWIYIFILGNNEVVPYEISNFLLVE